MITAVVGANWGDEGKGKITDRLAQDADYVVRFQGGSNAGHTIKNEWGKFALHLLPSGIFSKDAVSVIGNGVAVNAKILAEELKTLEDAGVEHSKLIVSDRAQVVMSYHMLLDAYEEERLAVPPRPEWRRATRINMRRSASRWASCTRTERP